MLDIIKAIEAEQVKTDITEFNVGDTVRVNVRIKEGKKERLQEEEGTVIKRQNGGRRETFTVRRVAYGTGVERTFPVNSPMLESIKVVRKGKVRRSRLDRKSTRLNSSHANI